MAVKAGAARKLRCGGIATEQESFSLEQVLNGNVLDLSTEDESLKMVIDVRFMDVLLRRAGNLGEAEIRSSIAHLADTEDNVQEMFSAVEDYIYMIRTMNRYSNLANPPEPQTD